MSIQSIITHGDHSFRVTLEPDQDAGEPWTREDGHGPVSDWTTRAKRPGERILARDGGCYRYYDFQAAMAIAKRDGWGVGPEQEQALRNNTSVKTRGQLNAEQVEADFRRLLLWWNGYWSYVGLTVTLLDPNGDPTELSDSVWGVEDDCPDYIDTLAREMAEQLASQIVEA